jgi:hypothetical protein
MEIIKLPQGETAPPDSDCVGIESQADGKFALTGTALLQCGDTEETESVALVGGKSYPSYDDAEAAGIAWAASHCVEQLYISRDAPLPE